MRNQITNSVIVCSTSQLNKHKNSKKIGLIPEKEAEQRLGIRCQLISLAHIPSAEMDKQILHANVSLGLIPQPAGSKAINTATNKQSLLQTPPKRNAFQIPLANASQF
jgi:hypothetical protein